MLEEFGDFSDDQPEDVAELMRVYEGTKNGETEKFFDEEQFVLICENYLINGKRKDALEVCQLGLDKYPYSVDLLLLRAQLMVQAGLFKEAHAAIDTAEMFNPNDVDIQLARVSVHLFLGEQAKAIQLLETMIDEIPAEDQENIFYQVGLSYVHSDKFKKAQEYFKKCIEINPSNELAVYEYLFTHLQKNEDSDFEAFFRTFIDKDPYNARAWYNLGLFYDHNERFTDSVEAFQYASDIDSKLFPAWFNLGMSYMNLEQWQDAIEAFDVVLVNEKPTAELLTHMGAAYEHLERYDKGIQYYKLALDNDLDYDEALYGIGSCLYELGQAYEAISYVQRAVELNEFNADYFLLLGDVESTVGNVVSACEAYEKASTLDPTYTDVWLQWSEVFFDQEEYGTASDLIGEALEVIPDDAELFYRMFVYLAHNKRFKEALSYLEIGLTLNFDMHTCIYDYFPTLDMQKKISQFVERYRKV